ncbi:hypothetical protein EVG20_g555 [Dentipellis fragilis]|uniref:Chromo domain-containing protein n=1 Tax=Dentipellis fragilis TaxID=205917 RepID=A0A4Y9ZFA3_9AGAM|nr:hypothetical protein EVG20_g555 [Dentipellis fragilis]
MARAADSDSEKDVESKKTSAKDPKQQATEEGDDASNAEGSEEEESEYEIESIIDAKRGIFGKGVIGYFVSWKGFGPEDNSWVKEEDAGNAKDLITEYWAKARKAKKASETKPVKAPRTSTAKGSSPAAESASTAKKRGRGRPSKSKRDSEEEEEDTSARARKKSRQSNGNGSTRAGKAESPALEESEAEDGIPKHVHPSEIKKYSDMTSWERLVEKVETVEKGADDSLLVYFKMRDLEPCVEPSSICAKKFPHKLIQFYEGALRWKDAEPSEGEAAED